MFRTISNIMKVDDLRRRILFTLLILIVYRIGAFIPVPNINTNLLHMQSQSSSTDVFGLLNTFSGGASINFPSLQWGLCRISRHQLLSSCFLWT